MTNLEKANKIYQKASDKIMTMVILEAEKIISNPKNKIDRVYFAMGCCFFEDSKLMTVEFDKEPTCKDFSKLIYEYDPIFKMSGHGLCIRKDLKRCFHWTNEKFEDRIWIDRNIKFM